MSRLQLNSKSLARIAAIQTIYQLENNPSESDINSALMRIIDFYKDHEVAGDHDLDKGLNVKLKPSYNFLREIVKLTYQDLEEIDGIITNYLTNERNILSLPKLLLGTLRIAICEIKYFPETPKNVILSEYTDITNNMLDEKEIGFVNSLLNNYATWLGR